MARNDQRQVFEVEPRDDGRWALQRERSKRASRVFRSKREAVSEGTRRGKAIQERGGLAQVRVKTASGQHESERTYGKDPRQRKG